MTHKPNSIFVFTGRQMDVSPASPQNSHDTYRGAKEVAQKVASEFSTTASEVSVIILQQNISAFLANMNTIISASPSQIGELTLDEIELYTHIDASGNIGIAEIGTQGGVKFILRKHK